MQKTVCRTKSFVNIRLDSGSHKHLDKQLKQEKVTLCSYSSLAKSVHGTQMSSLVNIKSVNVFSQTY